MTVALADVTFRYGEQDNVRVPKLNALTGYVQESHVGALTISIMGLLDQDVSEPLLRFRLIKDWTFGAGVADAAVAAAGSPVFSIKKNGSEVGTVTFVDSTGTVAFTDAIFLAGDLFELYPPGTTDATLDEVSISIVTSV